MLTTTRNPSDAIRARHRGLLGAVSRRVAAIVDGKSDADPEALAEVLRGELLPHAEGEERALYPAVEPLIRRYGSTTGTMTIDHEAILGYVEQIVETATFLRTAAPAQQRALFVRLQRLALKLEAILSLHQEKEERVILPLFEQHLTEREQQRVLDLMHEPD